MTRRWYTPDDHPAACRCRLCAVPYPAYRRGAGAWLVVALVVGVAVGGFGGLLAAVGVLALAGLFL